MARWRYFFLFMISVLSSLQISYAQNWSTTISGSNSDIIRDVYQKSDGSYIIAGQSQSFSDPTNGDAYLAKLDSSGTIVWQKTFGETSKGEAFFSVRPTSDGGYIAAGVSSSTYYDIYVVKVNAAGDATSPGWQKKFTLGTNNSAIALSVREAQAGVAGYILGGWAQIPFNTGDAAGLVLKLSLTGTLMWQNRFEVDGGNPDVYSGAFSTLEATSDGAIALGGAGGCPNGTCSQGLWILKIDSSGTKSWEKSIQQIFSVLMYIVPLNR
jgi:hypothetical protein